MVAGMHGREVEKMYLPQSGVARRERERERERRYSGEK
jgi:hypothetical protein